MRERSLLDRIRGAADLERAVPRLSAPVLHRVIDHCGLEDCADLLALATPAQLAAVLDLDLWRAGAPGVEERFDARRFGIWLETLTELGVETAAARVAALDPALVTVGLAQHVRVLDPASGVDAPGHTCDVWGYVVSARRAEAWDAILAVLVELGAAHGEFFHRVMGDCRRLSNSRPEPDGFHDLLDAPEQALFDLAVGREARREAQGYVTPEQARAFLEAARRPPAATDREPRPNPVAAAYFRAMAPPATAGGEQAPDDVDASSAGAVTEILIEEGVLTGPPRALLAGPADAHAPDHAHLRTLVDRGSGSDADAAAIGGALAYLANALLAGCGVQDRPLTPQEASDAAVAVTNLGLENWPAAWRPAGPGDVAAAFEVGWAVLYERVCVRSADRLVSVLSALDVDDRDLQLDLAALRAELSRQRERGTPWHARRLLEPIAILDGPSWAALCALLDELPVLHAAIAASRDGRARAVDPGAFQFIGENRQVAAIDAFLDALPRLLRR